MKTKMETGTIIDQYKILSPIGKGGMGEVFLAQDTKLDRKVALKILPPEFAEDKDRMSRFVREAKSASALNHPNIITIYEIGESDGTHFIATEFVDGKTLKDYARTNPLSYKSALEIAIQVASGLDEAHVAGIFHRDIKPDNVMIRSNGLAKILDFGIAKLAVSSASAHESSEDVTAIKTGTSPGMIIGTANYMSPEQARGREVDARTDIFSFGVVLYEMIAGRLPFEGENALEMIGAIFYKEAKPLNSDVPIEIQKIIGKCLQKDRDERYQTIKDVLIDLKDVKQHLEFHDKLERSTNPDQDENKTAMLAASPSGEIAGGTREGPLQGGTTNLTTSAGFASVATQAVSHKLAVVVIGILLLSIISAIAYFTFFVGSTKQIESIAVMPFVSEGGNQDIEYLSDGMTESLIKSLSNLPNLNVKPRSSVFRYKGKDTDLKTIGKELNVEAILNGRIVQRGEQITLSLELIDVQNDKVLWTEQYQRSQSDLVTLQSEIAKDVSSKLKSKLSGAEEAKVTQTATVNPDAYQAYLKGRFYWNRRTKENLLKAIEQFKIATDRDPNYALAYSGLADCYAVIGEYAGTPTLESLPQATAYAERAIALDGRLAEPHATLGIINKFAWKWKESEIEFKRAIEINPNYATSYHWYSILLRSLGRFEETAAEIKKAEKLDPLSSIIGVNVSDSQQMLNDHNASVETMLKIIELDPTFSAAHENLGASYLKLGRNEEGIAHLEKAVELSKRSAVRLRGLGYGYAVTGKRGEAIAIAKELEEKFARNESNGQYIASVYAGLGDKDKAFEWLEKDFNNRHGSLPDIVWRIHFESLRDDPRYKDLLKRMNLPE
ncbi:MAG: protein kinase [Acidobacteria bacterium]|nr:protein kinase [Acidobacteriota bacterium]